MNTPWWLSGVLYQIYPRSFADTNADGVGDLRGVIGHLDHLAWLGVDGIWLSPITVSPNADWGYDVADFCDVDPDYGTLADLDALVAEARARGIRVLLDLVPNHTSDRHPWFVDARSSRSARHRDWYVWADAPNNWVSSFGGPAWTLDEATGQYYLHNFLPEQPDLNWWNEEVVDAFDAILRFWWDRGIAGFRIDVANMIIKDRELRDNPAATADDHWMVQVFGQRAVYNSNRPEVHDVLRRWRSLAERYDPARVLIGETNVEELDTLLSFYGAGSDELHLAFNFVLINAPFEAKALRDVVEGTERRMPVDAWPVWTGSNHDMSRFPTRWAKGSASKARAALLMLLTLRGTPVLYQGDEIGMTDVTLGESDLRDPVGVRFWPAYAGRDPVRTPMPWTRSGGFTGAGVASWLPLGDASAANVEDQRGDPSSMMWLAHDLIDLRRRTPDLQTGPYQSLSAPPDAWAWQRGEGVIVGLNLSDAAVTISDVEGTIAVCTQRGRDGEAVRGELRLAPWEAAVVSR